MAGASVALTVHVWDNASKDQTVAKLKAAGISVIISQENVGFGVAVNGLASRVDTPFLLLLNPDAAPLPGAIDALVDAAAQQPRRDIFGGRTTFQDGNDNFTSAWAAISPRSAFMFATGLSRLFRQSDVFNPEAMPNWDRRTDREVDVVTGCALLIRTSAFRSLDGFDPRYWLYGEEADLQHRLVTAGGQRPWFVSKSKFIHDNSDVLPPETPVDEKVFRTTAVLRGRATIMRYTWTGFACKVAPAILQLTALRYWALGLRNSVQSERYRRTWQTRHDWMAGYPDQRIQARTVRRNGRFFCLIKTLFDPRIYIHAARTHEFYSYAQLKQRRQMQVGKGVEICRSTTFGNGARIRVGARTRIAAHSSLVAGDVHAKIIIGNDCVIGPNAVLRAMNDKKDSLGVREADIILEDGVQIGEGAVICAGVRISQGTIIDAGAVIDIKNDGTPVFFAGSSQI